MDHCGVAYLPAQNYAEQFPLAELVPQFLRHYSSTGYETGQYGS